MIIRHYRHYRHITNDNTTLQTCFPMAVKYPITTRRQREKHNEIAVVDVFRHENVLCLQSKSI